MHPQLFLLPWGKKFAETQDRLISIAHHLAGLTYNEGFYQNWDWSFINQFPKLQHYEQQQTLAREAFKAAKAAKGVDVSLIKLPPQSEILHRPNRWNAKQAVKRIMFEGDNNSFLATNPESSGLSLYNALGPMTFNKLPAEVQPNFLESIHTPHSKASNARDAHPKQKSKNKDGT
jgi:hypothetical protein